MNRNIYRLLKILHLIGLSLFLGSIFGHIVASVLGGAPQAGNEAAFLASRVHITAATRYLTMPGLLLTLATGAGMWLQSWSLKRDGWLRVHMFAAVLIVLLAFFVIVPAGSEMLRLAQQGVAEHAGQIKAVHKVEDMVGAANILLAVLATALGVVKPKWGKRQPEK